MTQQTQMLLIAAALIAIVVIAIAYRKTARRIKFDINRDGFHTDVEAHNPAGTGSVPRPVGLVSIKNSVQKGRGHRIDVSRGDVDIERFRQTGEDQRLSIGADEPAEHEQKG